MPWAKPATDTTDFQCYFRFDISPTNYDPNDRILSKVDVAWWAKSRRKRVINQELDGAVKVLAGRGENGIARPGQSFSLKITVTSYRCPEDSHSSLWTGQSRLQGLWKAHGCRWFCQIFMLQWRHIFMSVYFCTYQFIELNKVYKA